MARKRYAAEEIIGHLREAEGVLAQGESVAPVARRLGVAEPTYYRGRREDGGLRVDQAKRLKERERENSRRKRVVADQARDNAMARDGAAGTFCARPSGAGRHPPARTRTRCRSGGPARSPARRGRPSATVPRPSPDAPALIARSVALAPRCGRYGSRRIPARLRQAGWRVNPKRVERLWRQEGLRVPGKHPQRGRLWLAAGSLVRRRAERPSHVWSDAFVFDRTADGRPVRILAIGDADTREGLRLDVARRLRRDDGLARLAQLFVERGPPTFLRSANGPACTATAVRDWLHRGGGTPRFIEPGRPWANGSGESFNGTLRDACLNRERFATLREAPILIAGWRREDNPDPPPPCPRLPPPRPGNAATPGTSHAARPGDRTH